jgi:nonsense-mediated mRNA decay protein 3
MSIICPKCGRDNSSIPFVGAFCTDCYPIRVLAPAKIEVRVCKSCGMMFLKGEWMPSSPAKIAAYVASKCKGDFTDVMYDTERQVATFLIVKGDNKMEAERFVKLDRIVTTCPRCSRVSGGYYEAIIQLRGNAKQVESRAAAMMKKLAKVTFISKTEEKDNGVDIYVGDSKAVVGLMAELGMRALITKKLVGRDEGKQLYRTTFLVRC